MNASPTHGHLWANLITLMTRMYGGENQNRLARDAGVGVATISRIKAQGSSVGIDVLEKLAAVFGMDAWQLLRPGGAEECAAPASPLAMDLAYALDRIEDPAIQRKAHAIAVQVLALAATAHDFVTAPPDLQASTAPTLDR